LVSENNEKRMFKRIDKPQILDFAAFYQISQIF